MPGGGTVSFYDFLKEPISISKAYTLLLKHLVDILKLCDLPTLKVSLIHQAHTPDGVELQKRLKRKIEVAKSVPDLLFALEECQCCNWLDTRLIEVLAYNCESPKAVELIKAYQTFLFPKKLLDVLPKKHKHVEQRKDYVAAVHAKTKMDPDKITVGDFMQYRWTIEDVVLDLGKGILDINHVNEGCLEIGYFIPVYCSFNAYKMALHNRHNFYPIDLIHIEIGNHPLIYDPWLSDLEKDSVKEILQTRHDRKLSYCYIKCLY